MKSETLKEESETEQNGAEGIFFFRMDCGLLKNTEQDGAEKLSKKWTLLNTNLLETGASGQREQLKVTRETDHQSDHETCQGKLPCYPE